MNDSTHARATARGTPLGDVCVTASERGVRSVAFAGPDGPPPPSPEPALGEEGPDAHARAHAAAAADGIAAFLAGRSRSIEAAVDWRGLPAFQARVLSATRDVPAGEVVTYGALARRLGLDPGAARAVGAALAANPMPLVVPCHRVVGADGKLHGYSAPGGVDTKARLLRLEGASFQAGLWPR